jgi:hypothetical protein
VWQIGEVAFLNAPFWPDVHGGEVRIVDVTQGCVLVSSLGALEHFWVGPGNLSRTSLRTPAPNYSLTEPC